MTHRHQLETTVGNNLLLSSKAGNIGRCDTSVQMAYRSALVKRPLQRHVRASPGGHCRVAEVENAPKVDKPSTAHWLNLPQCPNKIARTAQRSETCLSERPVAGDVGMSGEEDETVYKV
eukprot:SAG31_NODE_324_length_17691_cov_8.128126_3_plen_119_part_00